MNSSIFPYPGLRPYKKEEAELFFGRERHIAEILRKLQVHKFVSIVGNSGSGKSSLVKAGVLPALAKQEKNWVIASLRPGENPILQLAKEVFNEEVFVDEKFSKNDLDKIYTILKKSNLGLVQSVRPILPKDSRLLIVVDQFEELFRFKELHHQIEDLSPFSHFVDLLLGAIEQQDVPIYVMMTLRSDFLGDCEQFDGLPEAINDGQFLVPRMNRDDLSRSITGPMKVAESKLSPRLVQQLLAGIGNNPDQLPILQHALMRTWEVWSEKGRPEQPMDIEDYEATGGMKAALSNHAEIAFSELKEDRDKKIAEVIFKTITVKTSDNRGVRRPTIVKSIAQIAETTPEKIIEVANVFRQASRGFIMPPANVSINADSILDISHESLMRVWSRLKNWVEEEGESAELYERITSNAILYEQEKASLWRNPDLQIALDWREQRKPNKYWAQQYNEYFNKAMRFIDASLNEKLLVLNEKLRYRRVLISSSIGLLIALIALTVWAISERNNAEVNAENANSEKVKTELQKKRAEEQTSIAQQNLIKAKEEERRAQKLQIESETQRNIAISNATQARLSKLRAEAESEKALTAKKQAEIEKQIAKYEKLVSDSLRLKAEKSEKKSNRLSLLSFSQNLAIRSKMADKNVYSNEIKSLLALQAFKTNKENGGKELDPEILAALFSAYRTYQKPSDYINRSYSDEVKSISYNQENGDLAGVGSEGVLVVASSPTSYRTSSNSDLIFTAVSFDETGRDLAVVCDDNTIHIFNSSSIEIPSNVIGGLHPKSINCIQWSNDALISASMDSVIRVIDTKVKRVINQLSLPTRPISMGFHAQTNRIIVGGDDGTLYTANVNTDKEMRVLLNINNGKISSLDINNDGNLLVIGTSSGVCQVIDLNNIQNVTSLTGHQLNISSVRFNPKGNYVATSSYDKIVRLYSVKESIAQPVMYADHTNWVLDVAFSPDGKELSSCGRDKLVITYPVDPNEMVSFLETKVGRNFTKKEWEGFVSQDIEYQKTIRSLN